ncbi:MAG TPA: hypothetical protein PKX19_09775, partial [Bacillota bacterium]|nr:hypothetical protein [Bacillota bacterium]
MMKRYGYLFWGVLSGLVGALAGSFILWGAWQLPTLGLLLTRVSLLYGFAALLILGALGGLLYAAVIRERRFRLYAAVLSGAILGLLLWA